MPKSIHLIFPHQLYEVNPLLKQVDCAIYIVEEYLFFKQYAFHKAKLIFHRASIKAYADSLSAQGYTVHIIEAHTPEADVRVLVQHLAHQGVNQIHCIDPVDDWLHRRLQTSCTTHHIELQLIDSPQFLNTANELLNNFFAPNKKTYFQTTFYKQQRIARNILINEQQEPTGGQWTFDVDNRKKYPKNQAVVETIFPEATTYWNEAKHYVQQHFPNAPGEATFVYPHTFEASKIWLKQFLQHRFHDFGIYEDAMVQGEHILHHSVLTPMLNVGLLTPQYIIQETLSYAQQHNIPLNSLEGFIRQMIGWREFIRGVYIAKGRKQRNRNFWEFTRPMPATFYTATTSIDPVDDIIRKVSQTGYAHHIERLMVLGNFMLLCEIRPNDVYRWFMELFIDAYDWVMVPNVYGMSQFADGGILSTKPYISGSNYLSKMSNYKKGPWQDIWDALFWRFLSKHRTVFLRNPRMGMLVKTFDAWPEDKKQTILQRAENYLATLN